MKKTDLTIDKVTTPEALRHQLRLLMHDRETEIAMVQVLLEGISRRHLEAYNNIALIHVIDWATRSVQSISTSLIVARILEIDDRTMNNIKGAEQGVHPLQTAKRYIEQVGIEELVAILHRIATDAMDILEIRGISDG